MTPHRARDCALTIILVFSSVVSPARAAASARSVESFLKDLDAAGIEVIYSSNLVAPDLRATVDVARADVLGAARAALAQHGLELWQIGPKRFVVRRAPSEPPNPPAPVTDAPLQEISVYASRYAIDGRSLSEPMALGGPEINAVPGSHDDALRAMKVLPGLASNLSGRPYIRGSLSEDVLVRYDGITLLDPYHLKNFQSLFSAIDPAAVEGIEVFSGGFPVQYGTRSGGVINVIAPEIGSGYENRIAVSTISAGASTLGHAESAPIEWFGAIRRSTLDQLEPIQDGLGRPAFSDSLGRLRWETGNGAWIAGWLILDDKPALGVTDDRESARARYRDEYFWLARDQSFGDSLRSRTNVVFTDAGHVRSGTIISPGVETGSLSESQEFDRVEITNAWTWDASDRSNYSFGAEFAESHSQYEYSREAQFAPDIVDAFGRSAVETLQFSISPEVRTGAAWLANRRRWERFEAEFGMRVDAQDFGDTGRHSQISPRLNLRYDLSPDTRLFASMGRFTQAQQVEEWRVEERQQRADPAQLSTHSVLGVSFDTPGSARWSVEAYTKRWTRVSPYFDNTLNPLSLLPDLAPDRMRIAPRASEASGLEINVRAPLFDGASAWGSASWARVADDIAGKDVLRSFDQAFAINAGLSWEGPRLKLAMLGNWHRGWPRAPYEFSDPNGPGAGSFIVGARNSSRWGDYYSLDLHAAWIWHLARGDFSTTLELTNATDHNNRCCTTIEQPPSSQHLEVDTDIWLPLFANLGFAYRWRNR